LSKPTGACVYEIGASLGCATPDDSHYLRAHSLQPAG
jgi:hypothetical protein